jgi:hypothetical protein
VRVVRPTDLQVEPAYQRDLSGRSISLIRKIVTGWDWAKFKPPVCAETAAGLFVIDGQHTAIAAASHPGIQTIPVLVVGAEKVERRADAFVAHNRDRLAMSAFQILHAEAVAGAPEAKAILESVTRAGGSIPRSPPPRDQAKPGQIVAAGELRAIHRALGPAMLERIVRIAVGAGCAPITTTILRALRMLVAEPRFKGQAPDAALQVALGSMQNVEAASMRHAGQTGQGRYRACAMLVLDAARAGVGRAA